MLYMTYPNMLGNWDSMDEPLLEFLTESNKYWKPIIAAKDEQQLQIFFK